jgi:putative RecB family exonuclease
VPIVTSSGEILDRPLVAVIDLLHRQNGVLIVTELKTSSRKFAESQIDTAMQATAYALAVEQKYDQLPIVQYTILVRTATPQVQRLNTIRQPSDLERFGDVVQSVERAIVAQAFYPIESPLNCSGCPFRLPCLDWRGSFAINQNAVFDTQFAEDTPC